MNFRGICPNHSRGSGSDLLERCLSKTCKRKGGWPSKENDLGRQSKWYNDTERNRSTAEWVMGIL